jgi:YfiH family protein
MVLTPITARSLDDIPGLAHGFFTREGGTSGGVYASLNCGLGSRDERVHVIENRHRVARHLETSNTRLLTAHQVHSAQAHTVVEPWGPEANPKVDALVTTTPGVAVAVLAADCAPVLLADPSARVVGAAHAGWRGALGGILEGTVAAMERLGAKRRNIRAALGPCIGPGSYEVGDEFEATFLSAAPANARYFRRPEPAARAHFDLPGYVIHRLERAGVGAVERATQCTYLNDTLFFSYRRTTHLHERDYGRQISAIVLR